MNRNRSFCWCKTLNLLFFCYSNQGQSHGQMTVRCHDAESLLQPWLLSTKQVQETKLFLSDSPRCWAVHKTLPSFLWLICLQNVLCWKIRSKVNGCQFMQITFKSPDDRSSNINSIDIPSDLWFLKYFLCSHFSSQLESLAAQSLVTTCQ